MTDEAVIQALEQVPVTVKLSAGDFKVKPLTVRRIAKLAALLKDVQGKAGNFPDSNSPEFHKAVADALIVAGDKMPAALALLSGDEALGKLDDISFIDLGAVVLAAAKANQGAGLKDVFRQAKEALLGKADQK